jgi:molybdopterin converting factor small subunit
MEITVKLHGILAEVAGKAELVLKEIKDLKDLRDTLEKNSAGLNKYLYIISVNRKIISGDKTLADGDHIDLIPPFPGG